VTALPEGSSSSGPGTPALRTYEPGVLRALLLEAGFGEALVEERSGHQPAVAVAP